MKKLSIFSLVAAGLLVVGCADDSLSPIITFDQAAKGAYVRLLELRQGEFDLANLSSSAFDYTVEFVDVNQGGQVSSYDIYMRFDDNSPDNGDNSKDEILFKSFGQSDFGESERGYKSLDVLISLTELASAFGLSAENDLSAGDFFRMRSELILQDGRKFTAANSTAPINGSAFQGFFNNNIKVTCPLPDEDFSGNYQMAYDGYPAGGGAFGHVFGENPGIYTLKTVSGSTTLREFEYIWLPGSFNFGPNTLRFDIVCTETQPQSSDTGAGCGSGTVMIASGGAEAVDINDDSEIVLSLIEYMPDGGCGVDPIPFKVILTKT